MWRGARPRRPQQWEDQPAPPKNNFPAYDNVKLTQEDRRITVIKETRTGQPSHGAQGTSLVQNVQQAVNTARKSSNRVAKLRRDIELRDAQ